MRHAAVCLLPTSRGLLRRADCLHPGRAHARAGWRRHTHGTSQHGMALTACCQPSKRGQQWRHSGVTTIRPSNEQVLRRQGEGQRRTLGLLTPPHIGPLGAWSLGDWYRVTRPPVTPRLARGWTVRLSAAPNKHTATTSGQYLKRKLSRRSLSASPATHPLTRTSGGGSCSSNGGVPHLRSMFDACMHYVSHIIIYCYCSTVVASIALYTIHISASHRE